MGNEKYISANHPLASLRYIDVEAKRNRTVTILVIILSFCFSAYIYFNSQIEIEKNRSRIYVLQNGNALLLASITDAGTNRAVEIKGHIKLFLSLLFRLSPDKTQINNSNKQVLYLGDESVKRFIDRLNETNFYTQLIANSANQVLIMDDNSIQIDVSSMPYKAYCKFNLQIQRTSSISISEVECAMQLRNIPRSDNNPHGLMIENFQITKNQIVKTVDRIQNQ